MGNKAPKKEANAKPLDAICPVVQLGTEETKAQFEKLLQVNRATGRVVITKTPHFLLRTCLSAKPRRDGLESSDPIWAFISFEFDTADVHHVRALLLQGNSHSVTVVYNPIEKKAEVVSLAGVHGVRISFKETAKTRFKCVDIIPRNGWNAIETAERVAAALFGC
jgi:hypothetical protein